MASSLLPSCVNSSRFVVCNYLYLPHASTVKDSHKKKSIYEFIQINVFVSFIFPLKTTNPLKAKIFFLKRISLRTHTINTSYNVALDLIKITHLQWKIRKVG